MEIKKVEKSNKEELIEIKNLLPGDIFKRVNEKIYMKSSSSCKNTIDCLDLKSGYLASIDGREVVTIIHGELQYWEE